ncbi:MAG: endopeptidase La, partial [Spirochaetales bacterium]
SAGITMAAAIVSLMTGRSARRDVAMTGEITLRGKVLQIGGLKEKILAAHRADIKHVVIPKENEKDLEKIPEYVRKLMVFHPVSSMEEVLFLALENPADFFKNPETTKMLYDKWKETMDEKKVDVVEEANWNREGTVQA